MVVAATVVVVVVIVATWCRRRGGAGIGDGTSAGSPGTTLSRLSATAGIIEIGLLLSFDDYVVVVIVALLIVAASTAGENRGGYLLNRDFFSRRRGVAPGYTIYIVSRKVHTYIVHLPTHTDTQTYTPAGRCAGSRG